MKCCGIMNILKIKIYIYVYKRSKKWQKKLPSVLAFEKKIVPSNGIMFATTWSERNNHKNNFPLRIISKSVKGTISNRLKASDTKDPAKLDRMIENANLQIVDTCTLPMECDTLLLFFTIKVLGNIKTPSACNDIAFKSRYENLVKNFYEKEKFEELGLRYAINIANGRFLWRNRVGSSNIEVHVRIDRDSSKEFIFNSLDYSLRSFDKYDDNVKELGSLISKTLASDSDFLNLEINAFVKMGHAQEVYPSEELVLDKSNSNSSGKKSKILFSIDEIAGMPLSKNW